MPVQQWSDRIWITQLGDEPGLSEDLQAAFDQAHRANPTPHMIVDLSSVAHVNSSNLSQLLRLRKLAIDSDAKLRLAGPNDTVWAVFLATGLDKVFEFRPDVTHALADLQIKE